MGKLVSRWKNSLLARFRAAYIGRTARKVKQDGLSYLTEDKIRRLERCASQCLRLKDGGAVEYGVALGGSAIILAEKAVQAGRTFHGYDVFGMIPAPSSPNDDETSWARYEVIASGASKGIKGATYYGYVDDLYGEVCKSFQRYGFPVGAAGIHLHKGLFEDTADAYTGPISVAHIDCDWYDPVRFSLNAVHSRLLAGGAIILDDYYAYGGCKLAVDEFLKENLEYVLDDGPNVILWRRA